jgi:hypothetical protein
MTAKVADGPRFLPKWQAQQISCQTAPSKYHAKRKYFCGENFTNDFSISFF